MLTDHPDPMRIRQFHQMGAQAADRQVKRVADPAHEVSIKRVFGGDFVGEINGRVHLEREGRDVLARDAICDPEHRAQDIAACDHVL